ncbi:DNA-3-methyladenine glycosylase 2 family protein [Streptomyces globosus]|uniref:DNA-3-methyladenine glycosylase family protein n=1 Tax=Streptomyces globosus TaxID=68209 RepID=UPI0031CFD7E5
MAGRFDPLTRAAVRGGRTGVAAARRAAAAADGALSRVWDPGGPVDLGLTLGPLRRGPGDPTFRVGGDGSVWRTTRTPQGPATLRVSADRSAGRVKGEAWGAGAEWVLDALPALLGAGDDPAAFVPRHRLVHESHRRRPGLRLTRTGLVLEVLVPTVLEQKVTADEAYRSWRRLVRAHGEAAPGPEAGLCVVPDARTWAMVPSWEWHRAGVDGKRSATIVRAARVAARLEEAAAMPPGEAAARLEAVPGIGPWTSAETLQRSNGDADAVTTGDLHLPGIIGYALAGNRDADDAVMLELLAPYAGQRHRAARLVLLAGRTPPRRAPRMYRSDISLI